MHLTRRRWDLMCLAATTILGIASLLLHSSPRAHFAPAWGLMLWGLRFWIAPGGEYHPAIKDLPVENRRLIYWTVLALALYLPALVAFFYFRMPVWSAAAFSIALGAVSFVLAGKVDARHPRSTILHPPSSIPVRSSRPS